MKCLKWTDGMHTLLPCMQPSLDIHLLGAVGWSTLLDIFRQTDRVFHWVSIDEHTHWVLHLHQDFIQTKQKANAHDPLS